jgi:hypothetical protein
MPESRTVLPAAPKLLNLTRVSATENAITLLARTSSRVALFVRCARGDPPGSILLTRGCWLTCRPGRESPLLLFTCTREEVLLRRGSLQPNYLRRTIARCRRAHYARRTERLDGWFTNVSFAL